MPYARRSTTLGLACAPCGPSRSVVLLVASLRSARRSRARSWARARPTSAARRGHGPGGAPARARLLPRARSSPRAAAARQARGPPVPRSVADLARRLPLERKVAQLFLFGFEGTDLNAEIFRRLRRLDLGGIVIGARQLHRPGPARPARRRGARGRAPTSGHVPPWVMAAQDGGEFNSFPGLPPADAPADLDVRRRGRRPQATRDRRHAARAQRDRRARPGRRRGLRGRLRARRARVLRRPGGGGRLRGRRGPRLPRRAPVQRGQALPRAGRGRPARPRRGRPASGSTLDELRERDLLPFRAAIEAGAPARGALATPSTRSTTSPQPASLSR